MVFVSILAMFWLRSLLHWPTHTQLVPSLNYVTLMNSPNGASVCHGGLYYDRWPYSMSIWIDSESIANNWILLIFAYFILHKHDLTFYWTLSFTYLKLLCILYAHKSFYKHKLKWNTPDSFVPINFTSIIH